jgi:hypothetical protein
VDAKPVGFKKFWKYQVAVLGLAFTDFHMGRDMILGTAIALLNLIFSISFRLIPLKDWNDHKWLWVIATVSPYVIVLLFHFIWRLLLAPAQMHYQSLDNFDSVTREREKGEWELRSIIASKEAEIAQHEGPEIFLHYDLPDQARNYPGLGISDKEIIVENTGDIDAYEVQVEDIALAPERCAATFLSIPRLPAHSKKEVPLTLRGSHVPEHKPSHFEMILYASDAEKGSPDAQGRLWFTTPISVVFRDYGNSWYRARFTFRSDDWFHFAEIRLEKRERIKAPAQMSSL